MTIRNTTENDNHNNDASPSPEPSNMDVVVDAAVVELVSVDAEVSSNNNNYPGGSRDNDVDVVVPLGIPEAQAYPVNDIEINNGGALGGTNSSNGGGNDRTTPVTISVTTPPSGKRFDIGIKEVNGNLYIASTKETSPFWNTGLRVGHLLLEINGVPCQNCSPRVAAALLPQSMGDNRTTIKVMEPRQSVVSIAPTTATATATGTATARASAPPPPPPGAPAGGTWITEKIKPPFAIAMSVICCIAGFFFWPAWCCVCCALAAYETRHVYLVHGVKYLANGARI